ncbi:hypothetical protein ACLOJK_012496 [Asimina triloba]
MEEGPSNGGMLYHEVQESKLCAVHCVNTVLQGPFFSELDFAALASDLDCKERQMLLEGGAVGESVPFDSEESHNVSMDGDFSIQKEHAAKDTSSMGTTVMCTPVLYKDNKTNGPKTKKVSNLLLEINEIMMLAAQLSRATNICYMPDVNLVLQKALEVWDLQVIPLDCPVAEPAQIDPQLENAFICHLQDHWFCIRKVDGEWYNFDSLYAAPEHLSKFYLSAYLDTLKGFGWSIFLVRGNFPKECPISSSEASNGFGQWLSPEDAQRITKSCNATRSTPQRSNPSQPSNSAEHANEAEALSEMEEKDLKAAIAASLLDSAAVAASLLDSAAAGSGVAGDHDDDESGKLHLGFAMGGVHLMKMMGECHSFIATIHRLAIDHDYISFYALDILHVKAGNKTADSVFRSFLHATRGPGVMIWTNASLGFLENSFPLSAITFDIPGTGFRVLLSSEQCASHHGMVTFSTAALTCWYLIRKVETVNVVSVTTQWVHQNSENVLSTVEFARIALKRRGRKWRSIMLAVHAIGKAVSLPQPPGTPLDSPGYTFSDQ